MSDPVSVIRSAEEHRRFLLDLMPRVADGRTNVAQANAIAGLSAEVHKSIKMQWEMEVYAAENLRIGDNGRLERLPPGRDLGEVSDDV